MPLNSNGTLSRDRHPLGLSRKDTRIISKNGCHTAQKAVVDELAGTTKLKNMSAITNMLDADRLTPAYVIYRQHGRGIA